MPRRARGVALLKSIEHSWQQLRRHPDAGVTYRNLGDGPTSFSRTPMDPPSGVNFSALVIRLETTC